MHDTAVDSSAFGNSLICGMPRQGLYNLMYKCLCRAKSPNITKKRRAAADPAEAAKGNAVKRTAAAAAVGDDVTHDDGGDDVSDDDDDVSSDVLPLASMAAARPRRSSHWAGDASKMEELEDCVLELQAEVAHLTEQVPHCILAGH